MYILWSMTRIGIKVLQKTLTKVLKAVENGARFTVYRHNTAIAAIVPAAEVRVDPPDRGEVEVVEDEARYWPDGMG